MSSPSRAAGMISGCLIWFILVGVFSSCLLPASFVAALFTSNTDLSAKIVGPMVCPAGSSAVIERVPTTFQDENGVQTQGLGAETVCANSAGQVTARPAPLPNWIWDGLMLLLFAVVSAVLALIFAAPAGVLFGNLVKRMQKK